LYWWRMVLMSVIISLFVLVDLIGRVFDFWINSNRLILFRSSLKTPSDMIIGLNRSNINFRWRKLSGHFLILYFSFIRIRFAWIMVVRSIASFGSIFSK
jgi:hypothetical protein